MPSPTIYQNKYGIKSLEPLDDLTVELKAYQLGLTVEHGGLGLAQHFKNVTRMLFGPGSNEPFIWHPWAETMNDVVHRHPVSGKERPNVAFSGCSSSGKSHYGALFSLINWLADPAETYVFVTSTSLS